MADVAAEGASGEGKMPQPDIIGDGEPEPLAIVDEEAAPAAEVPATPLDSTTKLSPASRKRSASEPQTSQQKRPRGRPPKKPRGRPPKTRSAAAAEADAELKIDVDDVPAEAAEAEVEAASPGPGAEEAEIGGQAAEAGPSTSGGQLRTFAKKLSGLENRMRLQEIAMEQVLGSQKLAAASKLELAVKELSASITKAVQEFNRKLRQ